jgi:hypothetical protein
MNFNKWFERKWRGQQPELPSQRLLHKKAAGMKAGGLVTS